MRKIIMLLLMLLGMVTNSLAQSPSAAPVHPAGAVLPSPATGTLVAIVGSAKGLVVAADSRSTIPWLPGTFCDDAFKILEPKKPNRTVVMVTGNGNWIDLEPGRATDICSAVRSSPQLLDIGSLVKNYIEKKNTKLSKLSLTELGAVCVTAMQKLQSSRPLVFQSLIGREVFSVVMADYDPKTGVALIRNFVVRIDADSKEIQAARFSTDTISAGDRWVVVPFGESDYFYKTVYHGVGHQFINAAIFNSMVAGKHVSEASLDEAVDAAVNTIEAAARTTELIPAQSGIGGPIDVVLLGEQPRPQKLRWKGQPQATDTMHQSPPETR
jgi:hypothetical protein